MKVKIGHNNLLENMKAATARWCVLRDEYGDTVDAVCSCCGAHGDPEWKYCPECRASMDVDKDSQPVSSVQLMWAASGPGRSFLSTDDAGLVEEDANETTEETN